MAYAGFDRADCPDLAIMSRLRAASNLEWCGFYLPAPSQSGVTWRGKRAPLVAQGWGLAPIFVGQQTIGPGSHNVTSTQGASDGDRACAAMRGEGFPTGSWVYLDLENGTPFTAAQHAYVGAWVDAVDAGGFRGGVYCSFMFAGEVHDLRPKARLWVFHVKTVSPHPVGGTSFLARDPKESGYRGAVIWQYDDEARLTSFCNLAVDLDSAAMHDPSAPDTAALVEPATPAAPVPALLSAPPADGLARRKWVQTFINAHGATPPLAVDGDLGDKSTKAIADYLAKLPAA